MRSSALRLNSHLDVAILARALGNGKEQIPLPVARYFAQCDFTKRDQARIHKLATGNQSGALSEEEKAELFAYVRAGTVLSILKSKARRALLEHYGRHRH